jgi:ABC-type lipoprotein export system ATPase subunit/ABC-type antimicrobial peptide transport system permease subunit
VRDVSLSIQEGEFVAIRGRSGSGKSTLMHLLGLLERPDRGRYVLEGREVGDISEDACAAIRSRQIGFVFQQPALLSRASALENVELPLIYAGVGTVERQRRARDAIVLVGLGDRADHRPNQLSGGEQQRVGIARAIVNRPALILADEPTGALDSRTGDEILSLFEHLHRDGHTIVVVTHADDVAERAHRRITIHDGRIVADKLTTSQPVGRMATKVDAAGISTIDSFRTGIRALSANMLRSFLTVLGIVIGVAAVICMVSVATGAQADVSEKICTLGANLLLVVPGAQTSAGARLEMGTRHTLTEEDAKAIRRQVEGVQVVAPLLSHPMQVVAGNRNWATLVAGINTDYLIAREWPIRSGRPFASAELESGAKVAIVGESIAEQLFGKSARAGDTLRIGNVPFTVIALLDKKGQGAAGRSQDDVVFIPLSAAKSRVLGSVRGGTREALDFIAIKATDASAFPQLKTGLEALLRQRHHLLNSAPDDFVIENPADVLTARAGTLHALGILLISIASVSLLVGGISIMNVMLVSVNERTREIGLRIAIGARRRDIKRQFLTEASVLALTGGLLGVATGSITAMLIAWGAGWPVLISPTAVVLAWGLAGIVGISFGLYPALHASRLDPILALRFE